MAPVLRGSIKNQIIVYIFYCELDLDQGRPTFFSCGPNLPFQKFGEPKVYRFFCQKVGEDQKKKGLRSDLISIFRQKVGDQKKKKKKEKKKVAQI